MRRSTSHSTAAPANTMTVWLLGSAQSPTAGQASRVGAAGRTWHGRGSRSTLLSRVSAAKTATTHSGAASTRAITTPSLRRARHHATSISTASRPRP